LPRAFLAPFYAKTPLIGAALTVYIAGMVISGISLEFPGRIRTPTSRSRAPGRSMAVYDARLGGVTVKPDYDDDVNAASFP
jgi:hypothetical protein